LRGRSHAHQGTFRDDHFAVAVADDWLLLAVSDGAGSARYSRYGAERLCEGTLAQLKDYLPRAGIEEKWLQWQAQPGAASEQSLKVVLYTTLVHTTFQQVKALEQEAQGRDAQLRDYAATLLLAACRPWEGGWLVVSFWIGDGALACLEPDQVRLLGQPDSGEFSGQTRFATMLDLYREGYEGLAPRLAVHYTADLQALLLLSDGITDPKFVSENALGDRAAWEPLWQELQRLYAPLQGLEPAQRREQGAEAFRLWLNEMWMAGEYDDRTILGVFA
jgi:serine/threonine protein phosphatase PrpC